MLSHSTAGEILVDNSPPNLITFDSFVFNTKKKKQKKNPTSFTKKKKMFSLPDRINIVNACIAHKSDDLASLFLTGGAGESPLLSK